MSCPSLNRKFDQTYGYSQANKNSMQRDPRPPTYSDDHASLRDTPKRITRLQPRDVHHNLQLETYSFDEILAMFGLRYTFNLDELKQAKRKVLMVHPDKSGLPPEYFMFYKRAFELVVNHYQTSTKQDRIVNENTSVEYVPIQAENDEFTKQLHTTVNKMDRGQFQSRFNELYEKNMASLPDPKRNEWFSDETASDVYNVSGTVNASNLNNAFESIKQKQREYGIVKYSGVRELSTNVGNASSFYDHPNASIGNSGTADDPNGPESDVYVSSDPFSKLRYEDLRKVHKDQTVFTVSDTDYANTKQYANVNEYSRARSAMAVTPMDKRHATQLFEEREKARMEQQARQQHYAELQLQKYAEKNRIIMGAFLHLENGV
jgi:hypothetical protein